MDTGGLGSEEEVEKEWFGSCGLQVGYNKNTSTLGRERLEIWR